MDERLSARLVMCVVGVCVLFWLFGVGFPGEVVEAGAGESVSTADENWADVIELEPISRRLLAEKTGNAGAASSVPGRPGEATGSMFKVRLSLQSIADVRIARECGVVGARKGEHVYDIDAEAFGEVQASGLAYNLVGGMTELSGEETEPSSVDYRNMLWTSDYFFADRDAIVFSWARDNSVPSAAVVTGVEYMVRVAEEDVGQTDFRCDDYLISLSSELHGVDWEYSIWSLNGDATDNGHDDDVEDDYDIDLGWRSTSYFNGEEARQEWYVLVGDASDDNDGELDYVHLRIHWESGGEPAIRISPVTIDLTQSGVAPVSGGQAAAAAEGSSLAKAAALEPADMSSDFGEVTPNEVIVRFTRQRASRLHAEMMGPASAMAQQIPARGVGVFSKALPASVRSLRPYASGKKKRIGRR